MKKNTMGAIVALTAASAACWPAARAQEARYLAGNCANCHGTDGHSAASGGMSALAGMPRAYFLEQLAAFRSGARPATIMHQLVRGYTDEQLARLAEFFERQPK